MRRRRSLSSSSVALVPSGLSLLSTVLDSLLRFSPIPSSTASGMHSFPLFICRESECKQMSKRIQDMRKLLVENLAKVCLS